MPRDDLTAAEVAAILDATESEAILVALRLMCEAGLWVNEIVTLRSLHVSYNRGGQFWLDVGARGRIPCSEDLAAELLALESDPDLPLVRYHASTIWRHLRRAAQRAGVDRRVTNERLRYFWLRRVADGTSLAELS